MSPPSETGIAKPTQFGELVPATAGLVMWLLILGKEGWHAGLDVSWLLLLALPLATWALLMRLRYSSVKMQRTIGPWRCQADLTALESIKWTMTGGWRSQGTIFVRDQHGGRVPIYVGRFSKVEEWGPLLLESAARCSAEVDRHSQRVLGQASS